MPAWPSRILTPIAAGVLPLAAGAAAWAAETPEAGAGKSAGFVFSLGLAEGPAAIVILCLLALLAAALLALIWTWRARNELEVYRDILSALPFPRQLIDGSGATLYANDAFARFFGRTDRATPELVAADADDEDAREQLERLAENARKGAAGHIELRLKAGPRGQPTLGPPGNGVPAHDPAVDWCYVAAQPVAKRPGTVFWMVDDITPRRQMEQVLREDQARFVDLLEHAPIGFYSVDAEGRFLFANATLGEWLGIRPVDMADGDLRLHDVIAKAPSDGVAAFDPFGGGGVGDADVVLKGADGEGFLAHIAQDVVHGEDGRVLRTRSVVRHLSREREMAEALAQSERRFRRFFEEAPVGIALLDANGLVTECNEAVRALTNTAGGLARGSFLLDIVAEPDRAAVRQRLEQVVRGNGAQSSAVPLEVRLGGERDTVCALFITPIETLDQSGKGFVVHFIDMSEQKSLEAQFTQSQKMQAVGQLAGGIAHDFNNLLTAMIGFSDLLLLRHRPGDQSFADVMQIKQNANRAANLVRQLLAFSRQQTLQPRILDITDILAELSHLLRRLIGENIELKMVHGRDLGKIRADQGQLEQVIINLAVNARDAMPEGGQLTITTGNVDVDRDVKRKGEVIPAGGYTRIEVADSGHGIDPENIDRIFEPFFSTKEVGAGTGLGLSTVYGIVKQTGGFIFVQSKSDVGTSFTILLPHHVESETEQAAGEAIGEVSRDLTGVGTVLLVEDEDGVRSFSAKALRNKGYEVLEARSGDVALEMLGDNKPIDLLITDVVMPRIDGPTLVKEVRESRPDLKVIFISGYTEDAFRKRLDQDTGIHFLPKPFTLKQLAGKVKEVMHEGAA